MMMLQLFRRLAVATVLLLTLLHTSDAAKATTKTLTAHEHFTAQVNWLTSPENNGYFSSKITYKNGAMYVTEHVAKDEVLMFIPSKILFSGSYENQINKKDEGFNTRGFCATVHKLAHEYAKGESSYYYPYINYIFDPRHVGDLPQTWTDEGKELLRTIVGTELFGSDTYDVAGMEHDEMCKGLKSEVELRAYELMLRRSWDDVMVPLLDMINHRNPPYLNVDSNSPHSSSSNPNDVHVVALRDIAPGEQLHNSYNQCTDCYYEPEYAYEYVAHKLLRDYGFVEQYPQRWNLFDGELRFGLEEVHPNLLPSSEGQEQLQEKRDLKVVWYDGAPTYREIEEEDYGTRLHGHLAYLKSIPVHMMVQELTLRPHEANTIIAFHDTLIIMIKYLLWNFEDTSIEEHADIGGTVSAPVTYGVGNKPLEVYDDPLGNTNNEYDDILWNSYDVSHDYLERFLKMAREEDVAQESSDGFELFGKIKTYHQLMTFWQTPYGEYDDKDVCFKIERNWESCQSNRPHYHELFVHYPATWMPQAKRMMFLGGGDSMILHEMLKYKELELVVGLELDKGVVQASLIYFETLPHFDKDKVEWWFGDCQQSLKLLPKEYLQSFDLIVVDLQNVIITALDIMKQVTPYAHPDHGLIIRNEDYGVGTNDPYALHNVDMYDSDVPIFGYQAFTMASNAVDFMSPSATRTLHEFVVPPLYFNPSAAMENDFHTGSLSMYNYRKVDRFGANDTDTPASSNNDNVPSAGVMMVLELEQVEAERMTTTHISQALAAADISVSETKSFGDGIMVFVAPEGYVIARSFPKEQYCAFDVVLWGSYNKIYTVEKQLALILDSGVKSSYRILISGSFAAESWATYFSTVIEGLAGGGGGEESKDEAVEGECRTKDETGAACAVDPAFALPIGQPHVGAAMKGILASMSTPLGPSSEILVLCGEQSKPCEALKVATDVSSASSSIPTTIYACPESEPIFSCEAKFRSSIHSIIENRNEINTILIDPSTPKESGESLYRILSRPEVRGKILSETVVVAGVVMDRSSSSSAAWLRNLLDRFRTDFFPFNPSFHAEVVFTPPAKDNESAGLGVNIYAANNHNFYTDFVQTVGGVAKTTGLSADVRYVKNAMNNYVPEFDPAHKFTRGSYDNSEARQQRKLSKPLGRQSLWQYDANAASTEYTISSITSGLETVLKLMNIKKEKYELLNTHKIGAGLVIFALFDGGDVTISYDGKSSLNVNLFTLDQEEDVHIKFEGHIFERIPSLVMKLGDMQPRGVNGVVTFDTDHYYSKMETARKARGGL